MLYGMYVSAAGALASSYRQDVVANNLANAQTVSFKRDLAMMQARPTQADQDGSSRHSAQLLEGLGGGLFALPTHTDFTPGSLEATDRSWDVALNGAGFFQVQSGDSTALTRDGRFDIDSDGTLVTVSDRLSVLDVDHSPIQLDPDSPVSIDSAGQITQNGAAVARLGVVTVDDLSHLKKQGNNLYVSSEPSHPLNDDDIRVSQGYVESSGVNAIEELTAMIEAQRMFQINSSMVQLQDETLGLAVSRLGMLE